MAGQAKTTTIDLIVTIIEQMNTKHIKADFRDLPAQLSAMGASLVQLDQTAPGLSDATINILNLMVKSGAVTGLEMLPDQITRLGSTLTALVAPMASAPTAVHMAVAPASAPVSARALAPAAVAVAPVEVALKAPNTVATAPASVPKRRGRPPGVKRATQPEAQVEPSAIEEVEAEAKAEAPQTEMMRAEVAADPRATMPELPIHPPAVHPRDSVHKDYIVCLEDGKRMKMLKRHLMSTYRLTPEQYRLRWNLPADYPMTAPNYSKQKSAYAKTMGLGSTKMREAVDAKRPKVDA